MPSLSNDQGRAYEYIFLNVLRQEISSYRSVNIINNSSFEAAQRAWNRIDAGMQAIMATSANAAVDTIFELEPIITEDGNDNLDLMIQTDDNGIEGDVRDILIIRRNIRWEIGLSLKHNSFAVKHSRLSKTIDFGEKWYDSACSQAYWDDVTPIFEYLEEAALEGYNWNELPDKDTDIYVPLLNAFIDEIQRAYSNDRNIPRRLVEYLIGKYDFYKVISVDDKEETLVESFNLHRTLNKPSRTQQPRRFIPVVELPTRIVSIGFKPGSTTTVELYLDGGWQFSFRMHNASTKVEASLKFDVQTIGIPATIITINCHW